MQRNIPVVHMNGSLFLELIGKSNEFWFVQARAFTKKCKAVIVVSATHAEAMPVTVKCDKRGEYQVKVAGFYQAAPFRFRDAIAIENQAVTGLELEDVLGPGSLFEHADRGAGDVEAFGRCIPRNPYRTRVTGAGKTKLQGQDVEDAVDQGEELAGEVAAHGEEHVELGHDLERRQQAVAIGTVDIPFQKLTLGQIRGQQAAELGRQQGGGDPVAGDIDDKKAEVAFIELEHVEQIAGELLARSHIPGEADARHVGQDFGQQ